MLWTVLVVRWLLCSWFLSYYWEDLHDLYPPLSPLVSAVLQTCLGQVQGDHGGIGPHPSPLTVLQTQGFNFSQCVPAQGWSVCCCRLLDLLWLTADYYGFWYKFWFLWLEHNVLNKQWLLSSLNNVGQTTSVPHLFFMCRFKIHFYLK